MNSLQRRFEILLPRRFNDGQPISDELFASTLLELRAKFGAVSSETQTIRGIWEHSGQTYRDELIRVYVDVTDCAENQAYFRELKERLKAQYQQIDIRITTYIVEVY